MSESETFKSRRFLFSARGSWDLFLYEMRRGRRKTQAKVKEEEEREGVVLGV